jgi:predicted HTH domain antitoxin
MRSIVLQLPDTVEIDNAELLMLLATRLYEKGRLSLGQAAELAGLSKRTFAELLGKYDVSIFNYPAEELAKDVRNAGRRAQNFFKE